MLPTIPLHRSGRKKAFTLVEALTSVIIIMYVLLSIWSIYVMGCKWHKEIAPVIEAQQIARIAIATIMEGRADSTTGQDIINGVTYSGRYGLNWIARTVDPADPDNDNLSIPPVTDGYEISYRIEADGPAAANPRKFYVGQDAETGVKAVYYAYGSAQPVKIIGTEADPAYGDISLAFSYDSLAKIVTATVRVEKRVPGTIYETSPAVVEYTDYAYIRNM